MRRSWGLAALIVGGVLLHAAGDAHARKGADRDHRSTLQPGSEGFRELPAPALSPDRAAREIERRHGGRVLAVQPDGVGYRVKMLKDGEVRIYQVSP